jgi:hypothetical protein
MTWKVPKNVLFPETKDAWPLCGRPRLPLSTSVMHSVPLAPFDPLTVAGHLPLKLCALAALGVSAKARIGNAVAVNAKIFLIIFFPPDGNRKLVLSEFAE